MKKVIILASATVIGGVFLPSRVDTPQSVAFVLINNTPDSATGIKPLAVLSIGGFLGMGTYLAVRRIDRARYLIGDFLGLEFRPATVHADTPKFAAENTPRPDSRKDGSGSPEKFRYAVQ